MNRCLWLISLLAWQVAFATGSYSDDFHLWQGDKLVGSKNFARAVNETCRVEGFYHRDSEKIEKDNKRCVISQIKFDYSRLSNRGGHYPESELDAGKAVSLYEQNGVSIYLKTVNKHASEGDSEFVVALFAEKDSHAVASLPIYMEINSSENFFAQAQYYYLDKDFTVWTVKTTSSESGVLLENWEKYDLDLNNGTIVLVEELSCNYEGERNFDCHENFSQDFYNSVSSVRIGEIEISREITLKQFDRLFTRKPAIEQQVFSQCTANDDIYFSSDKNNKIRMEFYPENNTSSSPLENGLLWLVVENFDEFAHPLYVGGMEIRPELGFSEFAEIFTVSAANGIADIELSEANVITYVVLIDKTIEVEDKVGTHPQSDGIPYVPAIEFRFENDRLKRVFISHGVAC